MAIGAILLGMYLASNSGHLGIQVAMLSLPPASLWVAVRHNRPDTQPSIEQWPAMELEEQGPVVAVAQALEIERLVQAS